MRHKYSAGGQNAAQCGLAFNFIRVFDGDQLFLKSELHQCIAGLAVSTIREILTGDSIWKTGNVDNLLVRVKKLRLTTRLTLGFNNKSRQAAVSRR